MNDQPGPWHEDELLRLRRELREADMLIVSLQRENAALGGTPASDPENGGSSRWAANGGTKRDGTRDDRGGPVYRSADPCSHAEAALVEARAMVVDLRIENTILRSRAQSRFPRRALGIAVASTTGAILLVGLLWLLSRNAGLVLFGMVVMALGVAIVHFIDTIEPRDGGPPPGPPLIPGG
ncbi:hypothetical protein [Chondromyces crocatus]|uniref:Uncharacterized protein n=1 Tax=Chondromyces crocatus TaxID=52 RepID=A0A0K1E7V6_CHOCO|nr:hypothetical protein [Chondromyces crocatus]AKT36944.1 uncharacterized protein CMC5_010650 [Chondromyces crocatus]